MELNNNSNEKGNVIESIPRSERKKILQASMLGFLAYYESLYSSQDPSKKEKCPKSYNEIKKKFGTFFGDHKLIEYGDNPNNGFGYSIYEADNEIFFAIKGVEAKKNFIQDTISAIELRVTNNTDQVNSAYKKLLELKQKYPNKQINVTGFSLGGGIAQKLGITDDTTKIFSFNSIGIESDKQHDNITNIIGDSFSESKIIAGAHSGKSYLLNYNKNLSYAKQHEPLRVVNLILSGK